MVKRDFRKIESERSSLAENERICQSDHITARIQVYYKQKYQDWRKIQVS